MKVKSPGNLLPVLPGGKSDLLESLPEHFRLCVWHEQFPGRSNLAEKCRNICLQSFNLSKNQLGCKWTFDFLLQYGFFLFVRYDVKVSFKDKNYAVLADTAESPVVTNFVRQFPAGCFRVCFSGTIFRSFTFHDFPAVPFCPTCHWRDSICLKWFIKKSALFIFLQQNTYPLLQAKNVSIIYSG